MASRKLVWMVVLAAGSLLVLTGRGQVSGDDHKDDKEASSVWDKETFLVKNPKSAIAQALKDRTEREQLKAVEEEIRKRKLEIETAYGELIEKYNVFFTWPDVRYDTIQEQIRELKILGQAPRFLERIQKNKQLGDVLQLAKELEVKLIADDYFNVITKVIRININVSDQKIIDYLTKE